MMNTNRRSFLASLAAAGLVAGHTSLHGQANPQRRYLKLPVEVVADRSIPTGQYKHPAAITELANGDLLLAWYGGDGEYAANTGVYAVRLPATARNHINGRNWSRPELIAQDPFRSVGNPVVWQAPASSSTPGWVWLFYVVRFGDTWSESHIAAKISKDGARTWSDASLISLDKGTLVRGKPIVLSNGETLLPIYREAGADREFVGDDTVSLFLRYQPEQKTWALSGPIRSRLGNLQPAPAEIAPGHLIAFCRRGGGYEARPDGWMVYAESHDFGRSWSEGRDLSPHFPNPNAAVDLLHLQNGHLLLVYNHSHGSRSPLSLALSEDNGKNWKTGLDVAGGRNDYAYPYLIQARDERIHLIYTSERRTQVNRMVFTEADIASTFPHSVTLR
jgi:predicted neuraminidase